MRHLSVLIISVFASEEEEITENFAPNITENAAQNSTLVKSEEDQMHKGYDALARKLIANGEKYHKFTFPIENAQVCAEKTSNYIGVTYSEKTGKWVVRRWSKIDLKMVYNGTYMDEEAAAHASDTLARKLISNGEKGHKLNFPHNDSEVYAKRTFNYVGVSYSKQNEAWCAVRRSKNEKKNLYNGAYYRNQERAAHASDALARKLIENGEKGHKLNFPDDDSEVYWYAKKTVGYIGVFFQKRDLTWRAQRWSKNEIKNLYNGYYKNEVRAAHASDTLARKLIANGEKGHKLNFPDDNTEVQAEIHNSKRKRPADFSNF